MIPVRATGVKSSHHVRGVGHHDHAEFQAEDGTRVVVAEYRRRTDPLTVTWWDAAGHQEIRTRGSVKFVLAVAGFLLVE